uniref:RNA-directed DNA polymerase n=1 Tax=Strigamia maritima TaxID=126957 RepID=T1J161_STRMM
SPGRLNCVADALSRVPLPTEDIPADDYLETKEPTRYWPDWNGNEPGLKLVKPKTYIPPNLKRRVIFACHGHPLSGHAGISKTLHRAQQLYFWPKMSKDIKRYVRRCLHCKQYKPPHKRPRAGPYLPHNMAYPWETICVDLCGPKPTAQGLKKCILVIVDQCTKYVELFPLATASSAIIIKKINEVACRWGHPSKIISDNGSQFTQPELYVKDLMGVLKQAHQNVYQMIQRNYERHLVQHNKKYTILELIVGDLVLKKTHILSNADKGLTSGMSAKRDVEVWSEDQIKATDKDPPNAKWMNDDVIDFLMQKNHPGIYSSANPQNGDEGQVTLTPPSDKPKGKHHRIHLRRDARKSGVPPKPHPGTREPRIRKLNPKYMEGRKVRLLRLFPGLRTHVPHLNQEERIPVQMSTLHVMDDLAPTRARGHSQDLHQGSNRLLHETPVSLPDDIRHLRGDSHQSREGRCPHGIHLLVIT